MILQSLVYLYDDLLSRGEISSPGWANTRVAYALCISTEGDILQVIPTVEEKKKGEKTVLVNQNMNLPAAVKRSSGIAPNFLWDNSSYLLGIDNKGKPQRSRECFEAAAAFHTDLLAEADNETAKAIIRYFEKWDPEQYAKNIAVSASYEDLIKGFNLVFRVNGVFAHEDVTLKEIWQQYYDKASGNQIQCLISGKNDVLETVHPALKGVSGAQSSGAALVSFNADAFCSYGKEQGANAPVGKISAFAYTTALNYLLADREKVQHIGDTTVVCWAEGAEPQYRDFSMAALFGAAVPSGMDENDFRAAVKRLADGLPCDEYQLSPEKEFYILGIAPNAARLSVRFFYHNTFGKLMKNINLHHERMQIVGNRFAFVPLWALLRETVNQKSTDKSPSPIMAGAVTRAIFTGTFYPAALLEATEVRIRAERNITPGRAAIIKAYYLNNVHSSCPKEVLTVSLNENSSNIPYTLGRLFAVYEAAQQKVNPDINVTIRDKYFNSVAATPAIILPILNNLYQKHLRKMDKGSQIYFEQQVSKLIGILGENLPARLSLPEQGAFQLGYYHQQQKRYEKKGS